MSKKLKRTVALPLILSLYALVAAAVVFSASRSGNYLDGVDTMFYVYRGDLLYQSITRQGNWYPLLDTMWYNGVQTLRYWSPMSAYVLAGCQALAGGSANNGFLLFGGILYFLNAAAWLYIGYRHDRPWLGAFIGLLWFFVPNTSAQMLYSEGVLARAMSMPVLPLLFCDVFDYLDGRKKQTGLLLMMTVHFTYIVMCHLGWAGMVAITLLILSVFYKLWNRWTDRVRVLPIFCAFAAAVLITGIWTLPSMFGGITSKDSSAVMATYFQELRLSIDPFYFLDKGVVNRWVYAETPYYGLSALLLTVLGVFCARKKSAVGFATALTILLMSTPTAYQFLVYLPGSQYLWMTRFMSIALCVFLVSFFFWRSLRRGIAFAFLLAFTAGVLSSTVLVTDSSHPIAPDDYHSYLGKSMLIDDAKEVTAQRLSIADPYDVDIDGLDVIAGFGDKRLPTSFGRGVQAASAYTNIVQVNEAAEQEGYDYLFDRCKELGNDTVIIPLRMKNDKRRDEEGLAAAAARSGYRMTAENENYQVYHLEGAPETFGVISQYRAIGIGAFAPSISIAFPAVEETDSDNLNDYTYEQLSQYDLVYLSGFTYTDREAAEELVLKLTENGVRVIIMADGMPALERTGTQTFLGVSAYSITISNGYPALDTMDGTLYCDLFPDGYIDWKTVYINGLDDVWGYFEEDGQRLDFYGTAHNENLIFIGLNLTFHYSLTHDPSVGKLLSHALTLSPQELPQRTVVPLDLDFDGKKTITIRSDYDDVNTTLARQDIFESDQPFREKNNLIYVDRGETVLTLRYPYLWQGCAVSAAGVLMAAVLLGNTRRRDKKRLQPAPAEEELSKDETTAGEAELSKGEIFAEEEGVSSGGPSIEEEEISEERSPTGKEEISREGPLAGEEETSKCEDPAGKERPAGCTQPPEDGFSPQADERKKAGEEPQKGGVEIQKPGVETAKNEEKGSPDAPS